MGQQSVARMEAASSNGQADFASVAAPPDRFAARNRSVAAPSTANVSGSITTP